MKKHLHPREQLTKPSQTPHNVINLISRQKNREGKGRYEETFPTLNPESEENCSQRPKGWMSKTVEVNRSKVNEVVHEANNLKNNVILLSARINKLKESRRQNQRSMNRSLQMYMKIKGIRERSAQKQRNKSLILQKREIETAERKQKVQSFRIEMKKNAKQSRLKVYEEKKGKAEEERNLIKEEQKMLQRFKEEEIEGNRKKAENVKSYEADHRCIMHQYYENSRIKSLENHSQRFGAQTERKRRVEMILAKMLKEEEKYRKEAEHSIEQRQRLENKLRETVKLGQRFCE